MQHTVPQFIEYEPKIVGPFTFKQFIYLGVAGAIAFILYFSMPFYVFLVLALILCGGALAFAFLKVGGRPLPEMIKNFFMFSSAPKIYLWRRPMVSPRLIRRGSPPEEAAKLIKAEPPPRIGGESKLQKLSTQVETKSK